MLGSYPHVVQPELFDGCEGCAGGAGCDGWLGVGWQGTGAGG